MFKEPLGHLQAPAQCGHSPEAGMGSPSLPRDAGAVVPLQRKIPPISFLEGIVGKEPKNCELRISKRAISEEKMAHLSQHFVLVYWTKRAAERSWI